MTLREVSRAIRRANIASLPLRDACRALANMPEARQYDVTPALIWRAARNVMTPKQADGLVDQAGIRGRIRLADLAYLAQYDVVLGQVISVIIGLMGGHERRSF